MLKERHLDIRRPVVQQVLRFRSSVSNIIRRYLDKNGICYLNFFILHANDNCIMYSGLSLFLASCYCGRNFSAMTSLVIIFFYYTTSLIQPSARVTGIVRVHCIQPVVICRFC